MKLIITIFVTLVILALGAFVRKYLNKLLSMYEWLNIFMPLVFYGLEKACESMNYTELLPYMIVTLILYNIIMLYYLCENTGKYISYKSSLRFVLFFFSVCLAQIMSFTVQFDILYQIDSCCFIQEIGEVWYERTFNIFLYCLGTMFANTIVDISVSSFIAKLISVLMLLSNVFLVTIFLGNYKEIGKIFQSHDECKYDINIYQGV